jgi:dTDP-4-dehydrorhamnose 3,5-epimerase
MTGVFLTKEKQILNPKGDIFHIMKKSSKGFSGFGEAYFTTILQNEIKGWKKHNEMTLNLAVPIGEVKFVVTDGKGNFKSFQLSPENYYRLTVAPKYWVAFQGLAPQNLIVNIANLEHNPSEAENIDLNEFKYEW